jgi:hypothetical protein
MNSIKKEKQSRVNNQFTSVVDDTLATLDGDMGVGSS